MENSENTYMKYAFSLFILISIKRTQWGNFWIKCCRMENGCAYVYEADDDYYNFAMTLVEANIRTKLIMCCRQLRNDKFIICTVNWLTFCIVQWMQLQLVSGIWCCICNPISVQMWHLLFDLTSLFSCHCAKIVCYPFCVDVNCRIGFHIEFICSVCPVSSTQMENCQMKWKVYFSTHVVVIWCPLSPLVKCLCKKISLIKT